MKDIKPLSRAQLKKRFGITPLPKLSKARQKKCDEVNALFDAVAHECDIRECEIFEGAYPQNIDRAHRELFMFLKNVGSCPKLVLEYAQKILHEKRK